MRINHFLFGTYKFGLKPQKTITLNCGNWIIEDNNTRQRCNQLQKSNVRCM